MDSSDSLKHKSSNIKKDFDEFKEKASEAKDALTETAKDVRKEIMKKSSDAAEVVEEYVRKNPFIALGAAAFLGAVITVLLRK